MCPWIVALGERSQDLTANLRGMIRIEDTNQLIKRVTSFQFAKITNGELTKSHVVSSAGHLDQLCDATCAPTFSQGPQYLRSDFLCAISVIKLGQILHHAIVFLLTQALDRRQAQLQIGLVTRNVQQKWNSSSATVRP